MSSSFYSPLIFSWGNINATALSSKSSFSRFDLFKPYAKATDEFMVRRTSNPSKIIIFPIMNVDWFGRMYTEGHFSITSLNRNINYLKMTISGKNNFKTVSNSVKWSYLNNSSANFLGGGWTAIIRNSTLLTETQINSLWLDGTKVFSYYIEPLANSTIIN